MGLFAIVFAAHGGEGLLAGRHCRFLRPSLIIMKFDLPISLAVHRLIQVKAAVLSHHRPLSFAIHRCELGSIRGIHILIMEGGARVIWVYLRFI